MDDGRNLNVTAWGRNITDEAVPNLRFQLWSGSLGFSVHQWGNPATYGVDFRLDL